MGNSKIRLGLTDNGLTDCQYALAILKNQPLTIETINAIAMLYIGIGVNYTNNQDIPSAQSVYNLALKKIYDFQNFTEKNVCFPEVQILINLGSNYTELGQLDSAEFTLNKALKYLPELRKQAVNSDFLDDLTAGTHINLASLALKCNDSKLALKHYKMSESIYLKLITRNKKFNLDLGRCQGNIGTFYFSIGVIDSARLYYLKSIKSYQPIIKGYFIEFFSDWARTLNELAHLYESKKKYDSALLTINQLLQGHYSSENIQHLIQVGTAYSKMFVIHMELKDTTSATNALNKSIDILTRLAKTKNYRFSNGLAYSLGSLAMIYYGRREIGSALYYNNKARDILRSLPPEVINRAIERDVNLHYLYFKLSPEEFRNIKF